MLQDSCVAVCTAQDEEGLAGPASAVPKQDTISNTYLQLVAGARLAVVTSCLTEET